MKMKKIKNHFFLVAIILFFSCAQQMESSNVETPFLSYTIQPIHSKTDNFLEISVDLKTDENGKINLDYQNNIRGEVDMFNTLKNIKTIPTAQKIEILPDSNLIIIHQEPDTKLTVSYQSFQDKGGVINFSHAFRPITQPTYFHAFGKRLLIFPEGIFASDSSKVKFELNWKTNQPDYLIHNSFGSGKKQTFEVTEEELGSSVFVGGDWKRYTSLENDNEIHLLTRGDWIPFSDKELEEILMTAMQSHKAFWDDYSDPKYSVTLLPTNETEGYIAGGTGLTNSFATFLSNNDLVEIWRVKYLFFHELLHHWTGKKIVNAEEEKQYWFSEGFTDYYTYKLMLRSEIIDAPEFIRLINEEVLIPHYQSEVKNFPNKDINYETFWGDPRMEKLPYRRGLIYAFDLDNQIRQTSKKSLDDMMREILQQCFLKKKQKLSHELFLSILKNYLGEKSKTDFDTYIEEGKLLDLSEDLPKGLGMEMKDSIPQLKINENDISKFLKK